MKRCVILGASEINDYSALLEMVTPDDYVICADGGYKHAIKNGITPDLFIGDFDSIDREEVMAEEIIEFPTDKDYTDLALAVQEGLDRGFRSFLFFGATGGRLDHSMANLTTLSYLCDCDTEAWLADERNYAIMIQNGSICIPRREGYKFSVLAWGGDADGVSISSAKYSVDDFSFTCSDPRGISNEFTDKAAEVSVRRGKLLIILSKY